MKKSWHGLAKLLTMALVASSGALQMSLSASASSPQLLSDQQIGELQHVVDKYHDIFGGLWGDGSSGIMTLKVAPGAVDATRQADALKQVGVVGTRSDPKAKTSPKKWRLRVVAAGPSLATLDALRAKVTVAQPWASDIGTNLVSWYIDPELGKLVIGVERRTATVLSDAKSTFGDLAEVVNDQPSPLHVSQRLLDSQPYNGSDRVSAANGSCTAGFEVYTYNGSYHYGMVTAGHCWSNGTIVKQGYYDSNGTLHSSGTMGKASNRVWGNNLTDVEFLDGTATGTQVSDWIWVGSASYPWEEQVHGGGTSTKGLTVCFDGSFTAENCQGYIDQTNVCKSFIGGYYECGLDQTHSLNGSTLAGPGDSGGPVEAGDGNGGLLVYGTDTGGDGVSQEYYSDLYKELSALGPSFGLVIY